jgi:hypothetical protein
VEFQAVLKHPQPQLAVPALGGEGSRVVPPSTLWVIKCLNVGEMLHKLSDDVQRGQPRALLQPRD